MKKTFLVTLCFVILIVSVQGRKTSRSRSSGSGRGTSRKSYPNPQPAPTSFSNPQASAPKPTLFGWQEKPAHNTQNYASRQSKPSSQSHGYPSSQTGLSGNSPAKQPPSYQESIQRSSVPQQTAQHTGVQSQVNNNPGHSYPSSNGLSGNSGSAGYPQSGGLSGSGAAQGKGLSGGGSGYPNANGGGVSGAGYPHSGGVSGTGAGYQHGSGSAGTGVGYPHGSGAGGPPPPYPGYKPGTYNHGNHAPPPYSSNGYNHGGYGSPGYHPSYTPQMPGYFGNNGRGFGGVSRSGSALTGIGIGAGVGTILTGLALWNLARSTGHHRHTVIYDNRGQPVAVAPANGTDPVVDPILKDLVNCSLTVSNENSTEVLAIPCAIATSFTPEADVLENAPTDGKNDNTKCTVTVVNKMGKEFMTTIPCSILLNTAAENNVTEPPLLNNTDIINGTVTELPPNVMEQAQNNVTQLIEPSALKLTEEDTKNNTEWLDTNCKTSYENGEIRDPINPCYAVTNNLTVLPLESTNAPIDTGH